MLLRTHLDIGHYVRGARLDRDLTQEALADASGVSRKAINELEAGRTVPRLDIVLKVLDALGSALRIDALGGASDRPPGHSLDDVLRRQVRNDD